MRLIGVHYPRRSRSWQGQPRQPPDRDYERTLLLRRRIERLTAVLLMSTIAGIVGFFIQGGFLNRAVAPQAADRHYSAQIAALSDAQTTLGQLESILADQKKTLEERQHALYRLQAEHAALSKVLAVDRASVEEIFKQQRQKNEYDVWKERGVAFLLGILSGLLTTIIVHWIKL